MLRLHVDRPVHLLRTERAFLHRTVSAVLLVSYALPLSPAARRRIPAWIHSAGQPRAPRPDQPVRQSVERRRAGIGSGEQDRQLLAVGDYGHLGAGHGAEADHQCCPDGQRQQVASRGRSRQPESREERSEALNTSLGIYRPSRSLTPIIVCTCSR